MWAFALSPQPVQGQNIITVAGTGRAGFNGDGRANVAQLYHPSDVAVDGLDNLYIADTYNNRIRKIDRSSRRITTVAGTGRSGSYSGEGGSATQARVGRPYGVDVDGAGNIYIVGSYSHLIHKVSASSGRITTVAGTGSVGFDGDSRATQARLYHPWDVQVDGAGNIYIADYHNHRIRKVSASSGLITTVAGTGRAGFNGDGRADVAQLYHPSGVAVDGLGNLYIADRFNHRIRVIRGIGGSPPPNNDLFSNPLTISGQSGSTTGTNVGATTETNEPGLGSYSVWWQWRAPSSGMVTIDTAGSNFDTTLGVYTGSRVDL